MSAGPRRAGVTEHELAERARALLARRLDVEPERITLDTVIDELGGDSLDLLTLAEELEDAFAVRITTREIQQVRTFGDIVRQLADKTGSAS